MRGCCESTCLAFRKRTLHFVADFREEWRDELHPLLMIPHAIISLLKVPN